MADVITILYKEHYDKLVAKCVYKLGRNHELAEDVVCEAFMRLTKYLSHSVVENPGGFLYKIVNNMIVDEYRKKNKALPLSAFVDEDGLTFDPADELSHKKIVAKAELSMIIPFLDELTPMYRQALILRFVKGLKPSEIAQALNTTENNISVRINRAQKHLKQAINVRAVRAKNNRINQ